jgi:hypothetical protein
LTSTIPTGPVWHNDANVRTLPCSLYIRLFRDVVWIASFSAARSKGCSRHPEEVLLGDGMQALIIRVLVVDDSEIVRRGICQILQSQTDIEVVGEAADGADAVRKVRQLNRMLCYWTSRCR